MQFIVGDGIKAKAGLSFVKDFLKEYDTAEIHWIRFNLGPNRDGPVGDCMMPVGDLKYRIACRFPNAFPLDVRTHKPPIYQNKDGTWPAGIVPSIYHIRTNEKTKEQWLRQYGSTTMENEDEAVVWTFGRAVYQWLRDTEQIAGRKNEIEIDAYADKILKKFVKECRISV